MSKKYPGLYLYFDWLRALGQLPPEVAMKIILNLGRYAEEDIEPEPLEELHYNIVQTFLLEQQRRSKQQAELGRRGGAARVRNAAQGRGQSPTRELYNHPLPFPEDDEDEAYDDPALTAVFERFGVPFKKNPAPDAIE